MKKYFFAFFILLSSFCVFAKGEPLWYLDLDSAYPRDKYLSGSGSGLSVDEAKAAALASMTAFLKSDVQTNTVAESEMAENAGEVTRSQNIKRTVTVSSDVTVSGVEYTAPYFEKKKKLYHAACYIERAKLYDQNDQMLRKFKKEISLNLENASQALDEKNPIEAYVSFAEADNKASLFLRSYYVNLTLDSKTTKARYSDFADTLYGIGTAKEKALKSSAIFIKVEGDAGNSVLNAVTSYVKQNGISVSKSAAGAPYVMECVIEKNLSGGGDDVYCAYPEITINLKCGPDVLLEYSGSSQKKILSFDMAKIDRQCASKCIEMLNEGFDEKLKAFFRLNQE